MPIRYIVLELCEGTLADVINKTYKRPELSSDMTVLNEIATGLHYIHSKKLVHRDIKPDNILISSNGRIKISDFDLCKETSTNRTYLVSGPFKGTKFWMPKELWIVPDNNSTPIKGSIESDIFSAGCVFFYFVTRGIHPFGDDKFDNSEIQQNIVDGNVVNFHRNY
jgi:serine/threonine protein kinase